MANIKKNIKILIIVFICMETSGEHWISLKKAIGVERVSASLHRIENILWDIMIVVYTKPSNLVNNLSENSEFGAKPVMELMVADW